MTTLPVIAPQRRIEMRIEVGGTAMSLLTPSGQYRAEVKYCRFRILPNSPNSAFPVEQFRTKNAYHAGTDLRSIAETRNGVWVIHHKRSAPYLSLTADAHWGPFAHRCALASVVRYWMTAQHSRSLL